MRTSGRVVSGYAAYPPPSAFRADYGAHPYEALLGRRDASTASRALAVYVHLPFCYSACAFCNCMKIVTRDGGKAVRYLDFLERDIAVQAAGVGEQRTVARMYWGGGTPTYYTAAQLRRIMRALAGHFTFAEGGEYTLEIDPRTVNAAAMPELRALGFNIAALGVPDLAPRVLEAVTRPQSEAQSLGAIAAARDAGFEAVRVDLMYGLPRQTAASFTQTLQTLVAARPDRLALHDYLHAPRRHRAQRQVSFHELPRASERLEMLAFAMEFLTAAGFVNIGSDRFVRSGDALAAARAEKRLHCDLLGYTAKGETDIVPVGASAIGATELAYTQNESELGAYYDRLGAGLTPVVRGLVLSPDDLLRRAVMRLLLCEGRVAYDAIEAHYSVPFERYFAAELQALDRYAAAGLVRIERRAIAVEPRGALWLRNLCAVFDRYGDAKREPRPRTGLSP